jgi:hypothetical protein
MRFILSILLIANFISCTNNNTKSENKSIAVGDSLAEIAFLDSIDMPCIYNDSVKKDFTFENELEEVVIVSYKNVRTFTQNKSKEKNEIIKNGKIHFKNFKEKLILKQNEIDSLKKNYLIIVGKAILFHRPIAIFHDTVFILWEKSKK